MCFSMTIFSLTIAVICELKLDSTAPSCQIAVIGSSEASRILEKNREESQDPKVNAARIFADS